MRAQRPTWARRGQGMAGRRCARRHGGGRRAAGRRAGAARHMAGLPRAMQQDRKGPDPQARPPFFFNFPENRKNRPVEKRPEPQTFMQGLVSSILLLDFFPGQIIRFCSFVRTWQASGHSYAAALGLRPRLGGPSGAAASGRVGCGELCCEPCLYPLPTTPTTQVRPVSARLPAADCSSSSLSTGRQCIAALGACRACRGCVAFLAVPLASWGGEGRG